MDEHVAHHHEGNALGRLCTIKNRCKLRLNGSRARGAGCGAGTKRKRTARKGCGARTTKGAQKTCYERATGNVARRMKFNVMPTEAILLLRHDNPHKKREHLTAVAYRIAWMQLPKKQAAPKGTLASPKSRAPRAFERPEPEVRQTRRRPRASVRKDCLIEQRLARKVLAIRDSVRKGVVLV